MCKFNASVEVGGNKGYKDRQKDQADNREHNHYVGDEGVPGIKMRDRKCTDPIVCCMFIIWIIFMIGISGYAFTNGDVERLAWKFDMDRVNCTKEYPKKLFTRIVPQLNIQDLVGTDLAKEYETAKSSSTEDLSKKGLDVTLNIHWGVCVKECPKMNKSVEYMETSRYKKKPSGIYEKMMTAELDNWTQYDTQDVMGFCFPTQEVMKTKGKEVYKIMSAKMGNMSRYMDDVSISWKIILVGGVISFFITLIYLYLLKWITKPILYISLFLVFIFGALITFWCYKRSTNYPPESDDYKYSITGAVIGGILTLVYTIFICCQWTNIKIGAEIMGVAGEFVSTQPRIMITPLVAYFCMIPIFIWFVFTNVYLYSCGWLDIQPGDMFATLKESNNAYWMFWFFLFGFFWIIAFFIAVMQFIIASVCALWYFTYQKSDSPAQATAINRSMKWAIKTHAGSLAFGAFLIAIVTLLKFVFEFFAKQSEKLQQTNPVVKVAVWCMRGCIWCLDACVKFVSENSYVQIAIGGFTFCEGAKNAFFMLTRNPGTYAATNIAGFLMTAIGKGTIMGASGYIAMLMADANAMTDGVTIQQPFVPVFFVMLESWIVAAFFISLFDFSCLTILQCFLISRELKCAVWAPDALLDLIDDDDERELVRHSRTNQGGAKQNQVAVAK